jgi:rare lipoprotein A
LQKGALAAAHRTLPFGTIVRVTNLENGRSVNVRINDRGPFKYHRLIDLPRGAANELKKMRSGEINVSLELIN